jgi:hypothetical protein
MPIDNAVLLQVDVTAIVGIFIFLTLQGVTVRGSQSALMQQRPWFFATSFLVIPFTVSAMAILIEYIWASEDIIRIIQQHSNIPAVTALGGFLYILLLFSFIAYKLERK